MLALLAESGGLLLRAAVQGRVLQGGQAGIDLVHAEPRVFGMFQMALRQPEAGIEQQGIHHHIAGLVPEPGIAPAAPPDMVMEGLRRAALALRDGSRARAEAALTGPAFPAGPQATLARLASLPRLPRVSEAAGAVAAELDRLVRRRS